MDVSEPTLTRGEWIEPSGTGVRMKFRRDGTGFYEHEGEPGTRLRRDNLLFRIEGETLHLKFAHARSWTTVGIQMGEGSAPPESRLGRWTLTLGHDPYELVFEERTTPVLALVSDSGAQLAG